MLLRVLASYRLFKNEETVRSTKTLRLHSSLHYVKIQENNAVITVVSYISIILFHI